MSLTSRSMSALRTRMQPCDGRPGSRPGWFVPWTPTTPPPGQSLCAEYALVPIANGPYAPPEAGRHRERPRDPGARRAVGAPRSPYAVGVPVRPGDPVPDVMLVDASGDRVALGAFGGEHTLLIFLRHLA